MQICNAEGHTFIGGCLTEHSVVLDLGANHGDFAAYIRANFPSRVVSVEANPQLAKQLKDRGAGEVVAKAISDKAGQLPFRIHSNDESSTLLSTVRAGDVETIMVPTIPLPQLASDLGLEVIDLVKVDIEGAEIAMFDVCSDAFLTRVGQFTVEFHDFNGLVARADVRRVLDRLSRLGFLCVNMWRTAYGDTLCVNTSLCPISTIQKLRLQHATRVSLMLKRAWTRMFSGRI